MDPDISQLSCFLSSKARRRSLQLKLENIEHKLARIQGELSRLEQESGCSTPDLFAKANPAVEALRRELKHLDWRRVHPFAALVAASSRLKNCLTVAIGRKRRVGMVGSSMNP